jgi:hypothetical protein
MTTKRLFFAALSALNSLATSPALAEDPCRIGDVCVIQSPLFGCKDGALIKRWIELYVEIDRAAAESFIADQTAKGECAQFKAGDKLRLLRYLGMRRLEVQRPGDTERFIMLLK